MRISILEEPALIRRLEQGRERAQMRAGTTDAISAKLVESHGFEAVYIGSYATAASRFGLPDTGERGGRVRDPHRGPCGPRQAHRPAPVASPRGGDGRAHPASVFECLAREQPQVLACMHGSAWRGDGAGLIRELARTLETKAVALPLAA